jgi:hypothetical protein
MGEKVSPSGKYVCLNNDDYSNSFVSPYSNIVNNIHRELSFLLLRDLLSARHLNYKRCVLSWLPGRSAVEIEDLVESKNELTSFLQ